MVSWCVDKNTFCKWRGTLYNSKKKDFKIKIKIPERWCHDVSTRTPSASHSDDGHWAPGVPTKEPKEPHISTKEPHMSTKEPSHLFIHIHKELFKSLWRWSLSTRGAHKRVKRAPYIRTRALDTYIYSYISTRSCSSHSDNDHWAPGVPAKESKEPYISVKELHISESITINLCIYI